MQRSHASFKASLASSLLAVAAVGLLAPPARAQDPFLADVRTTPWLTPEQEQKTFKLPPGFEIRCFAHEPDLFKPMNLAFDANGRLWCTSSTEYPYPVRADKDFTGRDRVTIFEDTDGDGVADRSTVFADGLDIPIGLLPTTDGCIVFSIPNIWRLRDTNGDDKADVREVLYGPMGWERDTHGLNNSFRRGDDGWVYANHGYNNRTTVKGRDGNEVHMESGNSYRFRVDGSRIEQFTHGQVNPFGSAFSPFGDLYTADCHTLPITVLVRGGFYESFGAPHDGLGFAPQVMHHLHGSTALCGLAYAESGWPAEYLDGIYVGNVMTCRVHHDQLLFDGSTPRAIEKPDLIESSDPWFRPVDLRIGPDGALYVADFYNRIIGHYEVPLDHPGRDRTSGRIWRVAYVGARDAGRSAAPKLRGADVAVLVRALAHPQQCVRTSALDELTDRVGRAAIPALQQAATSKDASTRALSLWGLFRLGAVTPAELARGGSDDDPRVRTQVRRLLAEMQPWSDELRAITLSGLSDGNDFVRRAAADALGTHADPRNVAPLIELARVTPIGDELLHHVAKIALRNQLQEGTTLQQLRGERRDDDQDALLAQACLGVRNEAAGSFALDHLERGARRVAAVANGDRRVVEAEIRQAAALVPPAELPRLAQVARARFADDAAFQLELIQKVVEGLDRRGLSPGDARAASLAEWAGTLIDQALAGSDVIAPLWRDAPVPGGSKSANPWLLEVRQCSDGSSATLLSSLPKGETLTGALRSSPFAAPRTLAFQLAGHNGEPDRPALPLNLVRVRDAVTNATLAQVLPPRSDIATRIELDLSQHLGKPIVLELVDGSAYDAYAWLAAGRFEPPLVTVPIEPPGQRSAENVAAARLASHFRTQALAPRLAQILKAPTAEPAVRAACAVALQARSSHAEADAEAEALAALIDDPDTPPELLEPLCSALAANDAAAIRTVSLRALEIAPSRMHPPVATALVRTAAGANALLEAVSQGKAPPALLLKPALNEGIVASLPADGAARIATLTKGLPPEDEARQRLINDRRKAFARHGGDPAAGARVFAKSCAACHKMAGAGAVVGPQLDGIASRGFERLCEDILAPNRNVDVQFVRTNYFMKDGDIVSALYRRIEGESVIVADEAGAERSLPRGDISQEQKSRFSLMPDNFAEIIPEDDFRDLLAYLMSVR